MEILLVIAAVLLLLFPIALHVRDRRVRPAAGGSTYRYVLRWMLLTAVLFLVLSIGDVAHLGWLVGLSALAMAAVGVTVVRDLGFGRGDRRYAGRYRPVRGRSTYSRWDGYRGD